MTYIKNDSNVEMPICPECMKEGNEYEFGDSEDGYIHCKNLYIVGEQPAEYEGKYGKYKMGQCHMVHKEEN